MILPLLLSSVGVALSAVVPLNITIENGTGFLNPDDLIPKQLMIEITPTDTQPLNPENLVPKQLMIEISNETVFLPPESLIPKAALVQNRATTACGCGYSVVNQASGRIVGGQVVNPMHKLPYQVYLQIRAGTSGFMCGGTLLNKRYVLTAMHCVENGGSLVDQIDVAVGEHDIKADIETQKAQAIRVEKIITRADYDSTKVNNDIALLRLSQDVQFNANVVPACLPTDKSKTYVNIDAVVSGWGTTTEGGSTSSVLKETTVKIVPDNDSTCTPYGNPLPNTKMCAYRQSTDSCQGDSGGPLVVQEDGRNTVVGVVSYGNGCAKTGYAGVYARVTTYLDWINQNIADGWCTDDSAVVFPSTSATTAGPATTTATTAPSTGAKVCDFTCTNVGTMTGDFYLNDILARCDLGKCYAKDGSDICAYFNYPCGAPAVTSTTTTTTTKATTTTTKATTTTTKTTTTTPSSTGVKVCDFTCTNVGTLTGDFSLNGILARCDLGKCYAKDGSDICAAFNYPCGGKPSSLSLTCSKPCKLDIALATLMSQYRAGSLERFVKVSVGYYPAIPSICDLETGMCCASDYPSTDLCYRLGWFATYYG